MRLWEQSVELASFIMRKSILLSHWLKFVRHN